MMVKSSNIILTQLIISLIIFLINFDLYSAFVKHQTDCPIKKTKNGLAVSNETLNQIENDKINKTKRNVQETFYRPNMEYYQCPGKLYKEDHIECCATENKCCPTKKSYIFFSIKQNALPLVIYGVLFASLFSVIILGLCCFWSICPLYNSCRIRYYRDESSCTDKMGETQINYLMPGEESPIGNTYVIAKQFDSDLIEERKIINAGDSIVDSTKNSRNKEGAV